MARTANNSKNTQRSNGVKGHSTAFAIVGELTGVYEGKKYNYVDIKVHEEGQQYYNTFTVLCDKNVELFDDGTTVAASGKITSFFDRQQQRTTYSFVCNKLEVIKDGVPF